MSTKVNYDVRPIVEAFEAVKNHYGNSFNYNAKTYLNGYSSAIVDCTFKGEKKQFAFASPESEPTLKENEYWLVYYYELPSTSSSPYRNDKSELKKDLISMLETEGVYLG